MTNRDRPRPMGISDEPFRELHQYINELGSSISRLEDSNGGQNGYFTAVKQGLAKAQQDINQLRDIMRKHEEQLGNLQSANIPAGWEAQILAKLDKFEADKVGIQKGLLSHRNHVKDLIERTEVLEAASTKQLASDESLATLRDECERDRRVFEGKYGSADARLTFLESRSYPPKDGNEIQQPIINHVAQPYAGIAEVEQRLQSRIDTYADKVGDIQSQIDLFRHHFSRFDAPRNSPNILSTKDSRAPSDPLLRKIDEFVNRLTATEERLAATETRLTDAEKQPDASKQKHVRFSSPDADVKPLLLPDATVSRTSSPQTFMETPASRNPGMSSSAAMPDRSGRQTDSTIPAFGGGLHKLHHGLTIKGTAQTSGPESGWPRAQRDLSERSRSPHRDRSQSYRSRD